MTPIQYKGFKVICYYTGSIILGFSLLFLLPIAVGFLYQDLNSIFDFAIAMSLAVILAFTMMRYGKVTRSIKDPITWRYGLVVASLTWVLLTMLSAIPLLLSGHMGSYLDACFDVMSGFTTTGVFLLQDLDHISRWWTRHGCFNFKFLHQRNGRSL
jgi:trk system potassium uptake protein TrkH